MKVLILGVLLSISHALFAKAEFPAGQGLSEYKQFLLYPHVDKAYRLVKQRKYQQAIPLWKDALNISADNIIVTEELVKTYIQLGLLDEAKALLNQQVKTYGENTRWSVLQFQLEIDAIDESEFEHLLASKNLTNNKKVELIYQFSHHKFDSGETEYALKLLEQNLSIDNQAQLLHRSYGFLLLKKGDLAQVEQLLSLSSFKHDSAYIDINAQLLEVYIASHNNDAALKLFKKLDGKGELTKTQIKQWAFILESEGNDTDAEALLLSICCDFDAQLHATLLNTDNESYSTVMNQLHYTQRLISNYEQEQRYILLFSEIVNQRYQLAHHFFRYQVKFSNNHAFWLEHALNLASSKKSYPQLVKLLESEKHLIKKHKRLLADTYWLQGKKQNTIDRYRKLTRYYPQDSAISTQYISYLVADNREIEATKELKVVYPYGGYTSKEREVLTNYLLNFLADLDKKSLQKILLAEREKLTLTSTQAVSAAQLWAKIGYCDKAESLFPKPLQKKSLLSLAHCYKDSHSVYAYDYFLKADALGSDSQTMVALAYEEMNQGDVDNAYLHWKKAINKGIQPIHYLSASQVAIAQEDFVQAEMWLATYEVKKGEQNAFYWDLKAKLASQDNNDAFALTALENAQSLKPTNDRLIELAKLQSKDVAMNSYHQAELTLKQLYITSPNDSALAVKIGNLLVLQGKQKQAVPYFERSLKGQPDNYPMQQKISYLYLLTGDRNNATKWSAKATENIDYYITEPMNGVSVAEQKFNQKRYNEQLHRAYNLNVDFWNGKNSIPAYLPVEPLNDVDDYANYWNAELLTAPNAFVTDMGEFTFYGRMFGQNSGDNMLSGPSGVDLLGIGVKYKPFQSQGIYLIAEPQYYFEKENSEIMLRASASFFASDRYSPQWHVQGNGWTEQELYIDVAYWLESEEHSALAKYTLGHNFKIESNLQYGLTVKPFVLAQIAERTLGFDSRLGAGVAVQLWSGGNKTMAYKRKSTLELQVDKAVNTYLDDDVGVSLTMRLAW